MKDKLFREIEEKWQIGGYDEIHSVFMRRQTFAFSQFVLLGEALQEEHVAEWSIGLLIGGLNYEAVLVSLDNYSGLVGVLERDDEGCGCNFHLRRFKDFDNINLSFQIQTGLTCGPLYHPYSMSYKEDEFGTNTTPDVILGIPGYRWKEMKKWLDEWLPISK